MVRALPILLFFSCFCFADMVQLQEVSIGARKFTGRITDLLLERISRTPTHELSLRVDTNVGEFFYWNNEVLGRTATDTVGQDGQFRSLVYQFRVGARVLKNLDFEYSHRSAHALDAQFGYVTEDSVGIRVYLYRPGWNADENTVFPWLR